MKHKHMKRIPIKVIIDPKKHAWLEAEREKRKTSARRRPYGKQPASRSSGLPE